MVLIISTLTHCSKNTNKLANAACPSTHVQIQVIFYDSICICFIFGMFTWIFTFKTDARCCVTFWANVLAIMDPELCAVPAVHINYTYK